MAKRTEAQKEARKIYETANPDRKRAHARAWRLRNPDRVKEHKKKDYQKHKDSYDARNRAYYLANKEQLMIAQREWYAANKDEINARSRQHRAENREKYRTLHTAAKRRSRAKYALYSIKRSASKKGVEFDLTIEWYQKRLDNGHCEMSGLPFDMSDFKRGDNSPSIDRIAPGGPYKQENCRMILWSLNHALGKRGQDYMFDMFRRAISNHDTKQRQKLTDLGLTPERRSAYAGM